MTEAHGEYLGEYPRLDESVFLGEVHLELLPDIEDKPTMRDYVYDSFEEQIADEIWKNMGMMGQ